MAFCGTVNTIIEGVIPAGATSPDRITIRGDVEHCVQDCTEICVTLLRDSVPVLETPEKRISVDPNDPNNLTWEVTFHADHGDFNIGDFVCPHSHIKYSVRIRCCKDDPNDARLTEEVGVILVCTEEPDDCPLIQIQPSLAGCLNQRATGNLEIYTRPPVPSVEIAFSDGTTTSAALTEETFFGELAGHGSVPLDLAAPTTGQTNVHVTVKVSGQEQCAAEEDIIVHACPPEDCPVDRVTLVVEDLPGAPDSVTCVPPGRHVVRADIEPPGATTQFRWAVNGIEAVVGQQGVIAINGDRLTLDIGASSRPFSISVVAAGCLSDGIELDPCQTDCCPTLDRLTANCMDRCPESTTVTLTATGENLNCAEVFAWDFGDGTRAETDEPTTVHAYPRLSSFDATVTMFRPADCGRPRTQLSRFSVTPCPPSCKCVGLAIATAFLLLALLSLLPMIACASDPFTQQILIGISVIVIVALIIVWLLWFLDPCCRPTRCELLRILSWVFSWALTVVGALAILQFCVSLIPFGLAYVVAQQIFIRMINDEGCSPGTPSIFDWPFPACR